MRIILLLCSIFLLICCENNEKPLYVAADIEDPKNEIAKTIVRLLNENGKDNIKLMDGIIPSIDSLESNIYQLMVVDNNLKYREDITVITPLYPQILHILHRKNYVPENFKDLVTGKKIYAGLPNSGSSIIVKDLIHDFQIDENDIEFVDVLNLFEADVIIQFCDLISFAELKDLQGFSFYSLDTLSNLGKGSIVEAICQRYPQYEPYVLPKMVYGEFLKEPILTISNEAILVCRKDLDESLVFDIAQLIHENKQAFNDISPLLYHGISEKYDVRNLAFSLHPGARKYLERDMPTYFERNSNLIGVLLTILIALISGSFTIYNFRKIRKKNKIDKYYQQLINIRLTINCLNEEDEIKNELETIKSLQNETIALVVEEELSANDSFIVFLKLSEIVLNEGNEKLITIQSTDQ